MNGISAFSRSGSSVRPHLNQVALPVKEQTTNLTQSSQLSETISGRLDSRLSQLGLDQQTTAALKNDLADALKTHFGKGTTSDPKTMAATVKDILGTYGISPKQVAGAASGSSSLSPSFASFSTLLDELGNQYDDRNSSNASEEILSIFETVDVYA
ncbi:hypothetical protein [Stratiformator vulcanicus]|uniref:Uncharacterized protein n=1 Tax=Stratiformator vulcanicus TaxID=2527980 RepID=A0A517QZ55_9PLAN|nr:hypothetical protein [Stratiformator vulcanicus]QDT36894.1 hypothetical protein Pan189_12580 [Stratiformator vulcanicus]